MLLQGNLQAVFDALLGLGVIDPVLEMDWQEAMSHRPTEYPELEQAVEIANEFNSDPRILEAKLGMFDDETLSYLAMEVAREYADFHWRKILH